MLFFVIFLLTLTSITVNSKECPKVKSMENFDYDTFLAISRWHEIERYDFDVEKGADCAMFDYFTEDGKVICLLQEVVDKKSTPKYRWVVTQSPDEKAKLYFTPDNYVSGDAVYVVYILDTDYNNYAIFYDCYVDKTNTTREAAWIGSRSTTLKPEVLPKIKQGLKDHPYIDETKMFKDNTTGDACKLI